MGRREDNSSLYSQLHSPGEARIKCYSALHGTTQYSWAGQETHSCGWGVPPGRTVREALQCTYWVKRDSDDDKWTPVDLFERPTAFMHRSTWNLPKSVYHADNGHHIAMRIFGFDGANVIKGDVDKTEPPCEEVPMANVDDVATPPTPDIHPPPPKWTRHLRTSGRPRIA